MTFTDKAGEYEVHTDGTNIWLYCHKHGGFGHTPPKYWKLTEINSMIEEHENEYHA